MLLAPIGIWLLVRERERALIYGAAGLIPPLAVLATYDLIAFGTLLPIGYEHSALWQEQHSTGFMSLTYPQPDALWGLTFSPFRGLFLFAPVLLLAVPGMVLGLKRARTRPAFIVVGAASLAFFLFIASSVMWWGGFSVGPRYLAPAIPLLALPLGATVGYLNGLNGLRRLLGLAAVAGLTAISGALIWGTTFAGQNYPSDAIRDPLSGYVLPALRDGDVARNLGMALQLDGIASLIPIMLIIAAGLAVIGLRLVTRPVVAT